MRSPEDRIYADELAELAKKQDGLELVYTDTRVAREGWIRFKGRVNTEMLKYLVYPATTQQLAYVWSDFVHGRVVASALLNAGLEAEDILTECFGLSRS